jgi:hypothetical protein
MTFVYEMFSRRLQLVPSARPHGHIYTYAHSIHELAFFAYQKHADAAAATAMPPPPRRKHCAEHRARAPVDGAGGS